MKKFILTPDILRQASQCETVEEILKKGKEFDEDITPEQARRVFEMSRHQAGPVSDEELDNVAGGGCNSTTDSPGKEICTLCGQLSTLVKLPGWPAPVDCCMNPKCAGYKNPINNPNFDGEL